MRLDGNMIISIKDSLRLTGIIIISFCATFVCTLFTNFYLDAISIKGEVLNDLLPLYDAQLTMAKFVCIVSGGCLSIIAFIMMIFYIKIYINDHKKQLGIFKAMGFTNKKIAFSFIVFGLSTFLGASLGFLSSFIIMPRIYQNMLIDGGPNITVNFHFSLIVYFIIIPTCFFSVIAYFSATFALKQSTLNMLKGIELEKNNKKEIKVKESSHFINMMIESGIKSQKSLIFFIFFACFSFSMVQMALSMYELNNGGDMGIMILLIGFILSITIAIMAITSLINRNKKNISMMKSLGYQTKSCLVAIFFPYLPFSILGYIIGIIYQHIILSIAINVLFKNTIITIIYTFNWKMFMITSIIFIIFYSSLLYLVNLKIKRVSLKEIMLEN